MDGVLCSLSVSPTSSISKICWPVKWRVNGSSDLSLCIKITAYSWSKKYSADADPLVPALKLSTNLTVLCSKGTVVPPDYNSAKRNEAEKKRKINYKTKNSIKMTHDYIDFHFIIPNHPIGDVVIKKRHLYVIHSVSVACKINKPTLRHDARTTDT